MLINSEKNVILATPPRWQRGLWTPRILQILLFRIPKARKLLRVPQFFAQNLAYGVLKCPGDPIQSVCSQGILAHPQRARKLRARLEKYARLSAGNFLSLNVLSVWVPGHNSVPGNVTMFFTTMMVCYSILWGLDLLVHFRTWTECCPR